MINVLPIGAASASNDAAQAAATASSSQLMGKDAFLQLLVAQIRNQNPLEPADGVEFLSQLAQFSQLEQTMGIREEISALRTQMKADPAASATEKTEGANNV